MSKNNVLGLDVGSKRIGVALMRFEVKIAVPLETIETENNDLWDKLTSIIETYDVGKIIVGLPRGLSGEETDQTKYVRRFAVELRKQFNETVILQDEALTSVTAEESLKESGKNYQKSDIDAQAACIILTDYINAQGMV